MTTTPATHINVPVATMGVERERVVGAFPKPCLETAFDKVIASARACCSWEEVAPGKGGV